MIQRFLSGILLPIILVTGSWTLTVMYSTVSARTAARPWMPQQQEQDYSGLIYGSSSPRDVELIIGRPPDEVVKSNNLYPVVWNYIYYAEDGSKNASVFVFENGMLVGLYYKTAGEQLVDLTYFLTNNGDRRLFYPLNAGYMGYYLPYQYFNPLYY